MRRRRVLTALSLIIVLAGAVVLLYPRGAQQVYRYRTGVLIEDYRERMDLEDENGVDWTWLYELIVAYNRELYENGQEGLSDPFSFEQVDFSLMEFGFDEEMIGYLSIPKMDVELPVYLGASQENLAKGAAHLTRTSLPVGGENTNAVIAAHRGMSTAAMFRDIQLLEVGDPVYMTNFMETITYRVAEIRIIRPTDVEQVLIQEGRDLITLITCHPLGANSQRYVVVCERVEDIDIDIDMD